MTSEGRGATRSVKPHLAHSHDLSGSCGTLHTAREHLTSLYLDTGCLHIQHLGIMSVFATEVFCRDFERLWFPSSWTTEDANQYQYGQGRIWWLEIGIKPSSSARTA